MLADSSVQHDRPPGARPRRLKGFWRAVRRQERWAVEIDKKEGFSRLLAMEHMHVDWEALWNKSTFLLEKLKMDGPWEEWGGGSLIVPFYCASPSKSVTLTGIRTRRGNPGPRKKRK